MSATIKSKEKVSKEVTTIKLSRQTKSRLDKLKTHPRETYDDTLRKVFSILNHAKVNPIAARLKLIEIESQNNKLSK